MLQRPQAHGITANLTTKDLEAAMATALLTASSTPMGGV